MVKRRSSPPLTIKSIKSRGYTPAYEARLIRAVRKARKQGKKPTRQAARGHKVKEHVIRKEREIATRKISSSQIDAVKSFLKRFNAPAYRGVPSEEDLVDYIRQFGYDAFISYRKRWDAVRQEYLKAQRRKELNSRGSLGYSLEQLASEAGLRIPPAEVQWMYYH